MFPPTETQDGSGTVPRLQIRDAVATLTLNRPAHRNRLHNDDLWALRRHFDRIESDSSVRVVVLTGNVLDERPVFCSGYHLGEPGAEHAGASFEEVADALEALRPLTVCAVNGSVYGGATDLVLACDFAVGVLGMEMRMPAAALGLHYYPGGISRYVSRLGVTNAKKAFLTAKTFDAAELLQMGFVQQLEASAEHAAGVANFVQSLLGLAPLAVASMKASLNEVARGDFDRALIAERHRRSQATLDFAEGCRAFAERRAPVFQGR